jgi:hypothetical protein
MKFDYFMMAGLPRSGSTLLRSILNQNPELHSGPISPSVELLYYTDKYFQSSEMLLASPQPESCFNVLSTEQFQITLNALELTLKKM